MCADLLLFDLVHDAHNCMSRVDLRYSSKDKVKNTCNDSSKDKVENTYNDSSKDKVKNTCNDRINDKVEITCNDSSNDKLRVPTKLPSLRLFH